MVRRTNGPSDSNIKPTKISKAGSPERVKTSPGENATSSPYQVGSGVEKALEKFSLSKDPANKRRIANFLAERAFGIRAGDNKGGIVNEKA